MFTVLAPHILRRTPVRFLRQKDDDGNNGGGDPETLQWVDLVLTSGSAVGSTATLSLPNPMITAAFYFSGQDQNPKKLRMGHLPLLHL